MGSVGSHVACAAGGAPQADVSQYTRVYTVAGAGGICQLIQRERGGLRQR
jgi:hypothetical protein